MHQTASGAAAKPLQIAGANPPQFGEILTPAALEFLADLSGRFAPRIQALLEARVQRAARRATGDRLHFLDETASIRAADWKVAPLPEDLLCRKVEITGPVERKMIINALNSKADVFMADLEDSNTPTWENVIQGQINLFDAVRKTITFDDPVKKKHYKLNPEVATLLVRPRGLHLTERHLTLNGDGIPGCLVDFGLYFFHNAKELRSRGTGPYFYIPKLESHLEARLWNEVFVYSQEKLGIPTGTIKATVLIETLPAAFEMDEILYELREHSSGLNCGRWDYIFSFIKTRAHDPKAMLPDRSQVGMTQPCMRAYTQLVIRTCHRRGVHAMGGMAAQIPIKNDPKASEQALAQVSADKLREARDGHDGTWVAHPGLVSLAADIFAAEVPGPNQLDRLREDVHVTEEDLLETPTGSRTEEGLRHNVRVGIQYVESWLRGVGCVPLYNLMEDAATAEISRTQVWQWLKHGATLEDGRVVDRKLLDQIVAEEMKVITGEVGENNIKAGRFDEARKLFVDLCTSPKLEAFLTLGAYDLI